MDSVEFALCLDSLAGSELYPLQFLISFILLYFLLPSLCFFLSSSFGLYLPLFAILFISFFHPSSSSFFSPFFYSLMGVKYLHVSRPPKDPATQKIYEAFNSTAVKMGIPFDIIHKKINIALPEVFWEHEQFSRKRVVAGTLSHRKEASGPLSRAGIVCYLLLLCVYLYI